MPRFRFRLSTLGLLIVIVAMAVALVIQQRRARALAVRVQVLEAETARDQRILERIQIIRLLERDEFQSKIAHLTGEDKDTGRAQTIETGEPVGPKQ
jgi:hypothetical protein